MVVDLLSSTGPDHVATVLLTIWHIWKSRCTRLYNSTHTTPQQTVSAMQALSHTIQCSNFLKTLFRPLPLPPQNDYHRTQIPPASQSANTQFSSQQNGSTLLNHTNMHFHCFVAGSFVGTSDGGIAFLVLAVDALHRYGYASTEAFSVFHAEALALLYSVSSVIQLGIHICMPLPHGFVAATPHSLHTASADQS